MSNREKFGIEFHYDDNDNDEADDDQSAGPNLPHRDSIPLQALGMIMYGIICFCICVSSFLSCPRATCLLFTFLLILSLSTRNEK